MKYNRQVADFKRKFKIKQVTSEGLCRALSEQGYTVIEFNGIDDNDDVTALKNALGVGPYMDQSRCFTYRDDKYRIVFIHEGLNEEERQVTLAHEEGHIWNDHLTKNNVIGNDVIQEHEANEFAHYLLKDKTGKRKKVITVATLCALITIAGIVSGLLLKNQHDTAMYTDNLYRTETGGKYHLRDCMFIKDKTDVYRLTREEYDSGEYEPCEACMPDER